MLEFLRIIAGSWPIAAMVIGIAAAIVIRRTFKQMMDATEKQNEYRASNAVVVKQREDY